MIVKIFEINIKIIHVLGDKQSQRFLKVRVSEANARKGFCDSVKV